MEGFLFTMGDWDSLSKMKFLTMPWQEFGSRQSPTQLLNLTKSLMAEMGGFVYLVEARVWKTASHIFPLY